MVIYKTIVNIKEKSPEEIFNWWMNLNHNRYTNWQKEHLFRNWKIKDNTKNKLGAKIKLGEKINGYIIKFNGKISDLKPKDKFGKSLIRHVHEENTSIPKLDLTNTN